MSRYWTTFKFISTSISKPRRLRSLYSCFLILSFTLFLSGTTINLLSLYRPWTFIYALFYLFYLIYRCPSIETPLHHRMNLGGHQIQLCFFSFFTYVSLLWKRIEFLQCRIMSTCSGVTLMNSLVISIPLYLNRGLQADKFFPIWFWLIRWNSGLYGRFSLWSYTVRKACFLHIFWTLSPIINWAMMFFCLLIYFLSILIWCFFIKFLRLLHSFFPYIPSGSSWRCFQFYCL